LEAQVPSYRNQLHALQAGIQTVGSFTNSHIIRNFARQTDQGHVDWFAPDFFQSAIPQRATVNRMLDLSEKSDGYYLFDFVFNYFTNDMLELWLTTYLASGADSNPVTARTYDIVDTAVYLTATILRPRAGEHMSPAIGGWTNVRWRFVKGAIIT
jgi:hypothetical protein